MTTTLTRQAARVALRDERTTTVRNGDIDLAVFEYGPETGETVLLVHGWPDTHHLWSGVISLLTDRFRVVAYDVRGHGESTNPATTDGFRLAALAADLFAVVDAVSPAAPVHVVAHDWGSVTAWEAVCEPDANRRIASFTSISGPNLDHLGSWVRKRFARPTPRNLAGPLSQAVSSAYTLFFMTPVLPNAFFRALGSDRNWAAALWVLERMSRGNLDFGPTLRQDMVNGLRVYRANIFQRVGNPRERRTTVPVQLIVNTRDVAVRPASFDDTDRWVTDLRRVDVKAGHWLPYARPGFVADTTRAFIDSLA